MSVRRPPFRLKVNQKVANQNPQKTSVRANKSLKDIFCGTPCIQIENIYVDGIKDRYIVTDKIDRWTDRNRQIDIDR